MTVYASLIKTRFIHGLQYRAAAIAGMTTQYAFGFMFISMHLAFYKANPSAYPMDISHVVAYVWIQQAFLTLYMTWFYEYDIFAAITTGQIAYDLTRPIDMYGKWYCQCIASRLSKALLRSAPILLFAFLLPPPYKLVAPEPGQLALFIMSAALASCVVIAFQMLVYISAFYIINAGGVRLMSAVLMDFMAGATIPLPFFPDRLRAVAEVLPFAAMQNAPLRIYSGNIYGVNAAKVILFQLFWLTALIIAGRLWMSKALRKVITQGG